MDGSDNQEGLDRLLCRLAEAGDEADWATLLSNEGGFMRAVARNYLGDDDLVEDVVQEAVMRIRRTLASYRSVGDGPAHGWLRGVVRHVALNLASTERSRMRRERTVSGQNGRRERERPAAVDPDLEERLESSLRDLPERQRLIIDLRYYAGLALDDIAVRLQLTANHVGVLHNRALQRLRRRLVRAGAPTLGAGALIALLEGRGAGVATAAATGTACGPATTSAARSTGRLVRVKRSTRWRWLAGAAGGAVAAAIVAFVVLGLRPPRPGDVIRRIPLPETVSHAGGCAAAPEAMWVQRGRRLHRVDPATGETLPGDPLEVPYAGDDARGRSNRRTYYCPNDLAWDDGRLWLQADIGLVGMRPAPDRLVAWDPAAGRVARVFDAPLPPGSCFGLAAGDGRLWTVRREPRELITLDQADGRVLGRAPLPDEITGLSRLAYVDGGVWLCDRPPQGRPVLYRLDPATAEIRARLQAPTDQVNGLCPGGPGELWVTGRDGYAYLLDLAATGGRAAAE